MGKIIAKCTDSLLKAREKDAQKINLDEMVGFHTDAMALLGHTQHELSLKRREAIRPSLKKEYAALCSQNVPVTSLLFGNDLQQQLNNIKRQIKSHKCQETQTNCKRRTTKEVLVAAERTDPRTSVTKGPFIPNTTG